MSGSTISTKVTIGVTLGAAGYASPLTITSTGAIDPTADGVTGIYAAVHAGTVLNQGTITGGYGLTSGAGAEINGSTITNDGAIIGGASGQVDYLRGGDGVYIRSGALINNVGGVITGGVSNDLGGAGGSGIILIDGEVTNAGTILAADGDGPGSTGAVLNAGTMTNTGRIIGGDGGAAGAGFIDNTGGSGVALDGATLSNAGTVMGGAAGVQSYETGGAGIDLISGSLTNTGTISGGAGAGFDQVAGGSGGAGLAISSGFASNLGVIEGGTYGQNTASEAGGAGVVMTGGTLTNAGAITAGAGSAMVGAPSQGEAVTMSGGCLTNLSTGLISGGSDAAGIDISSGTLINDGTIISSNGFALNIYRGSLINGGVINGGIISDTPFITNSAAGTILGGIDLIGGGKLIDAGTVAGTVQLNAATSFILDPGASFTGPIAGAGGNSLELAIGDGATGTLDMGGSFAGFSTIAFDPGALWTLGGTAAELADGETITGFTVNDTLILNGFAATSDTYVAGTGLELSNGVITETLDIAASLGAFTFAVSSQAGATTIALTYPPHIINTTVTTSVTLGSVYLSPLTITSTGAILPTAASTTGLYAATGTVTNQGAIVGGADAGIVGITNIGGIGVSLNFATLFNTGTITGGADIYASGFNNGLTHAGGIGVSLASGTVTNSGDIIGGAGGTIGSGGIAAALTGGFLTNTGTLTGGAGGAGGSGGSGASVNDASLLNAGVITGGSASDQDTVFGGDAGNGVVLYYNATLSNTGTITGGHGEINVALAGGAGIVLAGGAGTNSGAISGAGGSDFGGAGVQLSAGSLTNTGGITGGYGSHLSGGGVVMTGGTFTNAAAGTVTGGYGNGIGGEGGAGAFLSGGTATNGGTIIGGDVAAEPGARGNGGAGVYLNGGTFTNNARIAGGNALPNQYGVIYGSAGAGAQMNGGGLTNTGTVAGGSGAIGGEGATIAAGTLDNLGLIIGGVGDSAGGAGLSLSGGAVTNAGAIAGQTGFTGALAATGGAGGTGLDMDGGSLKVGQFGSISGGNGGYGVTIGGAGGRGAYLTGGSLLNYGFINGGAGGGSGSAVGMAGAGAVMNGGSLFNDGRITGGDGGDGGVGISMLTGSTANYGQIYGGGNYTNTSRGGDGVDLTTSSTFINSGRILGGAGNTGGTGVIVNGGYLLNGGFFNPDGGAIFGGSGGTTAGDAVIIENNGTFVNNANIYGGSSHFLLSGQSQGAGGAGVYLDGGTFANSGTLLGGEGAGEGAGTTADAVLFGSATGVLIAEPGAAFGGDVAANATAGDELQFGAKQYTSTGSLDMAGTFSGFSTIAFDADATWQVGGTAAELAAGQTIFGFATGDTLTLDSFAATSDTFIPGTGLELFNGSVTETLDLIGNFSTGSFIVLDKPAGTEIQLCYLRGTQILTPAGEVPIETLNIGDAVITRFNGYRRIKWIGRQSFDRRFIETSRAQRPIRIAGGALGPHLPKRDLYVSPGHSMLIGNVLMLASNLVNGVTITQDRCPQEVHYYQLEFETHDCVQAEGCWSESFCDYADLRNQFHNVADFHQLYPHHVTPAEHLMCAPRPQHGPALEAALHPITARAAALVSPGRLQGWIDHVHPSGVITGWAQDTAHPELPVLLEILLHNRPLGAILACDVRADLAAAGIGQGRAAFAFKSSTKLARAALSAVKVRRVADGATIPVASHCLAAVDLPRRKRARG